MSHHGRHPIGYIIHPSCLNSETTILTLHLPIHLLSLCLFSSQEIQLQSSKYSHRNASAANIPPAAQHKSNKLWEGEERKKLLHNVTNPTGKAIMKEQFQLVWEWMVLFEKTITSKSFCVNAGLGFNGLYYKILIRFLRAESVLLAVPCVVIANIDPRGRPLTSPTIRFWVSSVIWEHLQLRFTRVRVHRM